MRSLRSLPSQKTGAIYSLVLLVAVLALVIGILSVSGAKFSTSGELSQSFSPRWVQASAVNASLNVTITNDASSPAAIKRVDITKPSGVSNIECGANSPTGWTCVRGSGDVFVKFTNSDGLAAGSSAGFNVNITPPAGAGNQTFTIDTFENTGGTTNINSTNVNVSVDAHPPTITLLNISTAARNISNLANFDSLAQIFLNNASGGIVVAVQVVDNGSGVGNVTLIYNYTIDINAIPLTTQAPVATYFLSGPANFSVVPMANSSAAPGIFTYTISTNNFYNGSKVFFSILANDTVRNGNVSNKTSTVGWNFSIDAAAPIINVFLLANYSSVNTSALNTSASPGSAVARILNSTVPLNVSVLVNDDGGVGTTKVEVMNRTGGFMSLGIITGTNGSSGQTSWSLNTTDLGSGLVAFNITDLAQRVGGFNGDGVYNLSFRVTDNVSNARLTNITIEVDDTPPTGSVSSNLTIDGKLSEGNVTSALTLNSSFVLRLQTVSNIASNLTRNASVFGNKGLIHNLTFESGTLSGTSFWNITIGNATNVSGSIGGGNNTYNLSEFCDLSGADGSTCNFRFNFSDVLGRFNDTLNLTVVVDTIAPFVYALVSPVNYSATNYSTTLTVNVSVNDTVGPLRNVSFRWRNNTNSFSEGTQSGGGNVSNWQSMTLSTGTNNQFSTNSSWTGTLDISALVDGNYSIEINATDSGGNSNTSQFVSQVIFDSTRPFNVSIRTPVSNSFHIGNATFSGWGTTNITAVANESRNTALGNQSGIFNVSFRLENSSFNWPWVPSVTYGSFGGLTTGVLFSPNNANLTHWGGELTNATNGNFTVRLNVTDTSGNQNTSVTINLTIDTVLPGISFISPLNNFANNMTGNFTVNSTVTESNVAGVWFRWVNDSSKTGAVGSIGNWTPMTEGAANSFNGTFINLTVAPTLFDGNYSIELNVTDRAGNQNASVYITLLLDNNPPLIAAMGALDKTNRTGDFFVNLTINDTSSWNNNPGRINTSNINSSAFRLENATFNSSWFGLRFATTDLTNTDSNRTNATFTFSSVANGLYDIRFMVNDTAGNQNNSVRVSNIMLDNVAPGVALSVNNLTPTPSGGAGISGTLTFNTTITENLPVNISMASNTSTQGNSFGVFYRFESASVTTAWLPMSTHSLQSQSVNQPHNVVFNASNVTTTLTDGDYKLRINATDSAGNQNTSVYVDVTVQNGASSVKARNLTFLEGFWNGLANSSTDTYTFLVNTTANATCRYSLDTAVTYYDDMTSTMSNNVSRAHRINFGSQRDIGSGGHTIYYACKDISGNFTAAEGAASQFQFGVDTRTRWNVTIPGKTDSKWPNYFQPASGGSANGWSSFVLATGALESTTLASAVGGYNVTNVLTSLLSGTVAGNFTRIYAYTASSNSWETFVVGRTSNSFINFTNQTTYWINVTALERLEIN
ncbi:Ig-like domain repeat protein [Candidatus Woesearchaeota archaeon]|nr:Ig-like domain repeat protein [Candidatus Woesearchaeota archaeon]